MEALVRALILGFIYCKLKIMQYVLILEVCGDYCRLSTPLKNLLRDKGLLSLAYAWK
jgi:hypothetical protein